MRRGRDAIIYFERIRYFFVTTTNSKLPERRVTIVAFHSTKEFEPYRPKEFSSAFYRSGHDRDYIVMGRLNDEVRGIAAHEYVHLLIRHSGIEVPLWLNEGLAELYSTLTPVGKKVRVGDVPAGRLDFLRQKTMLPLEELTAADHESEHYNERDRAGVFYSQSWALTHMVNLSDSYREGSARFVLELANGAPAAEAFPRVYGKSVEEVYKDLRRYVHGDNFRAAIFDIKLEKSDDEIEAAAAGDLETRLLLGDLLAFGRNKDQARKLYEESVQVYPQAASIREALGYWYLRDGDRDQAKRLFADAVRLHSTNARLYYDHALLLRQDDTPNSEVIPLLERAVQLDDDLQEARLYLGYLLMDEQQFERALVAFARLRRVTREQAVRLYRAQSYAFYRIGKKDEAEKSLQLAKKHAQSPSEIDSVAKMEDLLRWSDSEPTLPVAGYSVDRDDADPPRLDRADAVGAASDAAELRPTVDVRPTVTITGTLENFECVGARAKMKIAVGGDLKTLAITDPGEIVVTGVDAGLFEFTCGRQNSRPLTIEYEPVDDPDTQTIGEVRVIHLE